MAETRSQMLFKETVDRETMAETRSQSLLKEAVVRKTENTFASRIQALEELVKEQNQKIDRNISEMLEAIRLNRFERVLDDPIAELNQLKETNGIVEYHKKFELLRTRVNLIEDYLVRAYLDGLQTNTQVNVKMFQPQTVNQCLLLGRLYEQAHPLKRDSELKEEEDKKVVEIEVKTEVETKSMEKMAQEVILKEELIPQCQVPVSNLEPSRRFRNASPAVCEDSESVVGFDDLFDHEETILVSYVKVGDESTCVTNNQVAHQLFDIMRLRVQSKTRHIKCLKCWRFKFKRRRQQRVALMKKKNKFSKTWSMLKGDCFQEDCQVYHETLPIWLLLIKFKFWKFKFMNRDLQKIIAHLLRQQFIFRWDSECIRHLSIIVHNLEASHRQSSFAFDAFQSGLVLRVHQLWCRDVMLHLKNKGRFRLLQSFLGLVLLALVNLWFSKAYELSGLLKDSDGDGAESFLIQTLAAEQLLLWLQNNSEKIHIVIAALNKQKTKICYKTWMFKYKTSLKRVQFLHSFDMEVPSDSMQNPTAHIQAGGTLFFSDSIERCFTHYAVTWAVQMIVGKEAPNVDITSANKQLEYTREWRRWLANIHDWCILSQLWWGHRNLTCSATIDKDFFTETDEKFQIKHKWRFKLLPSFLELESYMDSLVLVTCYAQQFDTSRLITLMSVGLFTTLRSQLLCTTFKWRIQ